MTSNLVVLPGDRRLRYPSLPGIRSIMSSRAAHLGSGLIAGGGYGSTVSIRDDGNDEGDGGD